MNMRKREEKEEGLNLTSQDPTSLRDSVAKLVTLNKPGGITLKTKQALVTLNHTEEAKLEKSLMTVCGISVSNGPTESTVPSRCLLALLHLHSALSIL